MSWTPSSAGNLRKILTLKSKKKICDSSIIVCLSSTAQIAKPMCLRNLAIVLTAAENYNP